MGWLDALCTNKNRHVSKWQEVNSEVLRLAREGRMQEARALGADLLEFSSKSLGKQHLHTIKAANNLGFILIAMDEHEEAETVLLAALHTAEQVFGRYSREVALLNMNLAKMYGARAKSICDLDLTID